ncbi:MAG: ParA family protein, partial [Actinomycetia bacterium]|nr:ParA family protein [Actinomycetes bacterium]
LELSIHDVFLGRVGAAMAVRPVADNLDVLPSTIDLTGTEIALHDRTAREYVLKTSLADVSDGYDFVLIDCSPSLGVLTINALTAADEVLIPLQCETLSHRGVGQLLETIGDVRRLTNRELVVLGVLPTLFDGRTTHARAVLADVSDRFGIPVLDPPINRSIRFAEAPASGESILSTASSSPGAQAYRAHALQLLGADAAA